MGSHVLLAFNQKNCLLMDVMSRRARTPCDVCVNVLLRKTGTLVGTILSLLSAAVGLRPNRARLPRIDGKIEAVAGQKPYMQSSP